MTTPHEIPEVLLTPRQAATRLAGAVSEDQLRRWAREGKVDHTRLPSGRLLFRAAAIDALLEHHPAGSAA